MSGASEKGNSEERLRRAPAERFKGPSHVFDLDEVAKRLRSEDQPVRRGHKQMTVFQGEHITHVVFAFEKGGQLAEHSAPGLVTIHVHAGRLRIAADGQEHDLGPGQLLVLAPSVPHDVRATEDSVMMLTVHVDREAR
ncbi:MAG: cupin domain-containing protein [Thioalkalivibrio sp.]|nr:cupin domain-containing protein [Thioalkalivibrio sp.]